MITEEEENQFRKRRNKQEGEPVIQTDPTLENRSGQASDAYPGMGVRGSPVFQNLIDRVADFMALRLRSGADLFQQILSDLCLQRGLRCFR